MYSANPVDRGNKEEDGRKFYKVTRNSDEAFIGYLIQETVTTESGRVIEYWHAENEVPKEGERLCVKTKDIEPATNAEDALCRLLKARKRRGGA